MKNNTVPTAPLVGSSAGVAATTCTPTSMAPDGDGRIPLVHLQLRARRYRLATTPRFDPVERHREIVTTSTGTTPTSTSRNARLREILEQALSLGDDLNFGEDQE